jgi:hypothetical protein
MSDAIISHAFVIPDENFDQWLAAVRPFSQKFERVAIIRSPRGNDLNRYRNVTAVNAPRTWQADNALQHIRRIYPMVVRVDIIPARTPEELSAFVQRRVAANDRYGEKENNPPHIFDRFILEYPVQYTPLAIVNPFSDVIAPDANYGVDFASAKGVRVVASTAGTVTNIGDTLNGVRVGTFVVVTTLHEGRSYRVTYIGLETVSVRLNQRVTLGETLGTCANTSLKLTLQEPSQGRSGYALPDIMDPTKALYITNLRVRPRDKNLRVRTTPSTSGEEMTRIQPWDLVESLEMHGRTLAKVGKQDQWLRVKLPDGRSGYTAAWFLDATIRMPSRLSGINVVGVNLDVYHPAGTPTPDRLGTMGWVRLGYNVSQAEGRAGSTNINAAYQRYAPIIERYVNAGYRVIMTTSHQTYGEGAGFVWPAMNDGLWKQLIDRFSDMVYRITRQWAGKGMIEVWQVWNEQDAHLNTGASVPMSHLTYHQMLRQAVPAMRAGDPEATILTGGYTGTQSGDVYARLSLRGLPADAVPDGIAIHPYGRSPRSNDKYGHFGDLDSWLRAYLNILPGRPLWITEWGVLDAPQEKPQDIGDYALSVISHIKANYRDQVATLCWYAWAEGMHNGYGLVDRAQRPRPGLTDRYIRA